MTGSMVQRISGIIKDYQKRLREMAYVPQMSFRRDSLRFCGDANKLSLAFLFSDHAIDLQFLKDVGLIRSKLQCDMAWHAAPRSLHVCGEVHALGVSHFTQFLAIAAFTDWSSSSTERREMFKFFCESLSGKNLQTGRD